MPQNKTMPSNKGNAGTDLAASSPGAISFGEQVRSLAAYASTGIVGTAVHYLLLFTTIGAFGVVAASTLGAIAGCVVNFFLARHFVFPDQSTRHSAFPRFVTVAGFGVIVNAVVVKALTGNTSVLISQLCATGTVFLFTYAANKSWTFDEPN